MLLQCHIRTTIFVTFFFPKCPPNQYRCCSSTKTIFITVIMLSTACVLFCQCNLLWDFFNLLIANCIRFSTHCVCSSGMYAFMYKAITLLWYVFPLFMLSAGSRCLLGKLLTVETRVIFRVHFYFTHCFWPVFCRTAENPVLGEKKVSHSQWQY